MNKVDKSTRRIFLFGIFLFFSLWIISMVTAENPIVNETINLRNNESIVPGNMSCEDKLEICGNQLSRIVEEHNDLLKDFRDGTNCGRATTSLKYMNNHLGEERDKCIEEIGKIKVYKTGFYIFFGVLIVIAMSFLFQAMKKKNNLNK